MNIERENVIPSEERSATISIRQREVLPEREPGINHTDCEATEKKFAAKVLHPTETSLTKRVIRVTNFPQKPEFPEQQRVEKDYADRLFPQTRQS